MATAYNWPGGTGSNYDSWYSDDRNVYSTGHYLPSGNEMLDGSKNVLVTHVRAWVAGRGAARSVRMGLDGRWTDFFTVAASTGGVDTGWRALGEVYSPGTHIVYIDPATSGGIWFKRSPDGTGSSALVGLSGGWSGSLLGQSLVVFSPTAPRNLSAVRNDNGTITVSWDAPSSDGGGAISAYYINKATNASFTTNATQTNVSGSTFSYTFSGLAPGETYYFRVSAGNALNVARGWGSLWSNVASALSSAVPSAPGAPIITKTSPSATTFDFTWTAAPSNGSDISTYELQWSTTSDFASVVGSDNTSGTAKSIPGFSNSTKYYFRVRGINALGNGTWSPVTTYPVVPSAPSAVGVASVNSTTLTASWNPPSDVGGSPITNYRLEWSVNADFSGGLSSTANNTSRNVSSLTALTVYYFRVRAESAIGNGPWSPVASYTTADTEPPPPPPVVTRGGRLRVDGVFIEPIVRVRVAGEWKEPRSRIRVGGVWVDPV